jgi:hypothetical protein
VALEAGVGKSGADLALEVDATVVRRGFEPERKYKQ